MKNIINEYMKILKIKNFKRNILASKEESKRAIKFCISPNECLRAKLLYSFNIDYKLIPHRQNEYDYNFNGTVREFHERCDDKR